MKTKDLPIVDVSSIDPEYLKIFFDNEKLIKTLNKIPKKKITIEQFNQLREAVAKRPELLRGFSKHRIK